MSEKLKKYLQKFKPEAKEWFENSPRVESFYKIKKFFKNYNFNTISDFEKLVNNLEYYTEKNEDEKYHYTVSQNILNDFIENFKSRFISDSFGRGRKLYLHDNALTQIISVFHPPHYTIYDAKIIETLKFVEVSLPETDPTNFLETYRYYRKKLKENLHFYNFEIYGKRIDNKNDLLSGVSDLFEFTEFLFWVYEKYVATGKTITDETESHRNKTEVDYFYEYTNFIEKHKTENTYNDSEKILDICIKQIKIEDYQGIKNIHISEIPVDTQWIFLTGENGYGKTSVLQAITIGLFGNKDNGRILDKKEEIQFLLEYKISSNNSIINTNKIETGDKYFSKLDNFVAYGTSRLNKNVRPHNDSKTYSLFNTSGELLDIEDKLINWEKDEIQNKYYQSAKKILLDLLSPHISKIEIIREGTKALVKYKETDSTNLELKKFEELATGFRSIIAMIGDIMIRLSENQPEIDDFKELIGIVIIDELDLHLHPKFQREIVVKLTNTFPKVQFIASTHSPIPLLGAPKNSIFIKVDRSTNEGITAEVLDIDLKNLTPNLILTSPIFNFNEIISSESNIENVETADQYQDFQEDRKLKEEFKINELKDDDFFNSLTEIQ